ncbi:DUF3397 domain-containing protein [Anaerobacillus isosaccharinicus]|uniref:DUF3397 domain-containing protein n=1 Tax=Anaerobacillus isosaccharinicus TaxID=1532552 RepID=A0A1S2M7R2_9BACI|nr:DUF3397 domain-containing protein [Anaerobacillus isosaccharinicus]MBA5587449.1 DUF3397 domain-containing protein [Anaerobacillus isosaccharinicus]QOY34366.1 DUF3397 domain-containing protein [Anaerobacillus isosaccharinicus]
MSDALAWMVATFVTLPIFAFYLVYIVTVKATKNKKKSIKLAVDISASFFIIAVYFIAYEIWSQSLFWVMIISLIVVAMIFTVVHWKISEDIHLGKLLKGIWRFNFLLYVFAYILLSVYGLFISIYSVT